MAINYPVSELADRYTIARLKYERIESVERLAFVAEMDIYHDELKNYEEIGPFLDRLYEINGKIWDLEASIRSGQLEGVGLDEIGRRALKIRDENRVRVGIKREMVMTYGEGWADLKQNYSGEDDDEGN